MPPLAEPWPLGDIYVCGGNPSAAAMECCLQLPRRTSGGSPSFSAMPRHLWELLASHRHPRIGSAADTRQNANKLAGRKRESSAIETSRVLQHNPLRSRHRRPTPACPFGCHLQTSKSQASGRRSRRFKRRVIAKAEWTKGAGFTSHSLLRLGRSRRTRSHSGANRVQRYWP